MFIFGAVRKNIVLIISKNKKNILSVQKKVVSLHPISTRDGVLAQVARAFDWQSKGHRFDSDILHQEEVQMNLFFYFMRELNEWRKFIKSKYPNIHIVYSAEESGNVYYVTNDVGAITSRSAIFSTLPMVWSISWRMTNHDS